MCSISLARVHASGTVPFWGSATDGYRISIVLDVGWMDDPCPVSSRRGSCLASSPVVCGFGFAPDAERATSLDDGVSATGILVVVSG